MQLPQPLSSIVTILKSVQPDLRPGYVREFHEEVLKAVRDGKLAEEELAQLESRREELGLSQEVLDNVRQDLYLAAFEAVKEGQAVTDTEWDELEHIQDFLGLSDSDVHRTKKELYRMRILHEIQQGNMPIFHEEPIVLKPDEAVHWSEPVALMKKSKTKKKEGTVLSINPLQIMQYVSNALMQKDMNEEGWIALDKGKLIITSKRAVFKGKKDAQSMFYKEIIDVECYKNGLKIFTEKHPPVMLRYIEKGNHNVVGSILLHAIAYAQQ